MNVKTLIPLVLAVGLGLLAMFVVRDMANKGPASPVIAGTEVAVLNKDLPAGSQITSADVTTTQIGGSVNTDSVFTSATQLEGRVLTAGAVRGAPVLATMLAPQGTGSGLQALIPEGMRALTIKIDEFSGVGGNLTAGCRVDVVTTMSGDGGTEQLARTVVQNVKVQHVGRAQAEGDAMKEVRSVTLLATPKEAEAIELAASTGHPRLVLRSGTDTETSKSMGVSLAELRRGVAGGDPFALIMPTNGQGEPTDGSAVTPVSTPTTQPLAARQQREERRVTIIRGGVESHMTVEVIKKPAASRWMTGVGTDELPGGTQN